jgi:hypothetical protein
MDALSGVFTWLSDHEAGISAVVGIAVLAGIVFACVHSLIRRRAEPGGEIAPAAALPELQLQELMARSPRCYTNGEHCTPWDFPSSLAGHGTPSASLIKPPDFLEFSLHLRRPRGIE